MLSDRVEDLVSIVVPVHNAESYIGACLSSLATQTYKNVEILVVDDGSTDATEDVVATWRQNEGRDIAQDRFAYLRLPRNTKQPGAVTTGLFMARGQWIATQAADDLSHPERLEKQVRFLQEHPDVEMLGTRYATFFNEDLDQQIIPDWLAFGWEAIRQSYSLGQHCVCDGTLMLRGATFDRLGGWNRRLQGVSDYEFVARYVEQGVVTENLQEVLYYYRDHPAQTTKKLARGEMW